MGTVGFYLLSAVPTAAIQFMNGSQETYRDLAVGPRLAPPPALWDGQGARAETENIL